MSEDKKLVADEAARGNPAARTVVDAPRASADEAAHGMAPGTSGTHTRSRGAVIDREPSFEAGKIVFFCPNGHRIQVERAWAGKHGTCSKQGCGVPVVIPMAPGEPPGGGSRPVAASGPALPAASAGPAVIESAAADAGPGPGADADGWSVDFDAIDHPTARLVAALWRERANGGVVEVHLSGGSVIMPQWYDPLWSCGTHALFGAPGPDDSITLTAVAWDQILKVVVRQLRYVPEDMFPG